MVSSGEIPLTVVDSDIARLNKTYYSTLDISLEISFPQRASWGVSPANPWLADSIDSWFKSSEPNKRQAQLLKRYFEMSKDNYTVYSIDLSRGKISPYDDLFKKYAKTIGWDWRLIAAQGFAESHFDTTVVSWAGARGIMQIMPQTAEAYGLSMDHITDPEANISTAVKIIGDLEKSLKRYISDPIERRKFILAAYNSGIAHVYDAIALAEKHGKDPEKWDNNVAEAILMKANPEYYNDPVCRFGYFRGKQTTSYVEKVLAFYDRCRRQVPK
jgi:membrane-bound lytic murein transglycosylase F